MEDASGATASNWGAVRRGAHGRGRLAAVAAGDARSSCTAPTFPTGSWPRQLSFRGLRRPSYAAPPAASVFDYGGLGPDDRVSPGPAPSAASASTSPAATPSARSATSTRWPRPRWPACRCTPPAGANGVAYAGYQAPADWRHRPGVDRPGRAVGRRPAAGAGSTWPASASPGPSTTCRPSSRLDDDGAAGGPGVRPGDGRRRLRLLHGRLRLRRQRVQHGRLADRQPRRGRRRTTSRAYRPRTTINGPTAPIDAGQQVTLPGSVVDGRRAGRRARLVLEAQGEGGGWDAVDGADGADPALTVAPGDDDDVPLAASSTGPLAEGSVSDAVHGRGAQARADREPRPPAPIVARRLPTLLGCVG